MSSQWNLVQSIWHFMDRHPQQGYMTNKCSWCCYSIDFDFDFAEKVYKNQEKLENILQLTRKETVRKIGATALTLFTNWKLCKFPNQHLCS